MQAAVAANDMADDVEITLKGDVDRFAKTYAVVEQNFADKPNPDKSIYKGAIPGMLRTLDPHSNFFDPRDYRNMLEEQHGQYFGVGMTVSPRNEKTVVVVPFPGSPAYKAGIRPGDVIVTVNDKPTAGLNTTEVADLLKGPRGTQVRITISREGAPDYISLTVTRDEIYRKSVQEAFWIKPGIVYVRILQFADTTARELEENLKRLGEGNIKGLVLDLRNNPGGLLNQGVAVADHFLQKGQLIVSHHGRSSSEKSYFASSGNHGRNYPIVSLVNRFTASAAEIVAGALQDHDRAWILGDTTFGKGLVQTVYPLSDRTALALTTAHYYTPSGRLIQRDYSHQSFYDYYNDRPADSNPLDVKMTDSGRTVYGGNGIAPDEKFVIPKMNVLQAWLYREGLFNFTRSYFGTHSTNLPKGWMPDEAMLQQLHEYVLKQNVKFTEEQFTANKDWILRHLAREMYTTAFNVDESDRMFAQTDPEVQKAVDSMPKAVSLVENAKKTMAAAHR
jgi:carboxyl-terminal processing protease